MQKDHMYPVEEMAFYEPRVGPLLGILDDIILEPSRGGGRPALRRPERAFARRDDWTGIAMPGETQTGRGLHPPK